MYFIQVADYDSSTDSIERDGILTLLFMMCSCIVYSTTGMINDSSFIRLSSIKELRNMVQVYDNDKHLSDIYLESYAPYFLWILQDTSGTYRDKEGNNVSSDLYLEQVLMETQGTNSEVDYTKDLIINLFKRRSCIDLTPWQSDHNPGKYLEDHLRQPILLNSSRRKLDHVVLNTQMMISYLINLIEAVNKTPDQRVIPADLLDGVVDIEIRYALDRSMQKYSSMLREEFGNGKYYGRRENLDERMNYIRSQAIAEYGLISDLGKADSDTYRRGLIELKEFISVRENAIAVDQVKVKQS